MLHTHIPLSTTTRRLIYMYKEGGREMVMVGGGYGEVDMAVFTDAHE